MGPPSAVLPTKETSAIVGVTKPSQKLVSYLGLNPSVRQSGPGPAHHGQITKQGPGHARGMLVEAAWARIPAELETMRNQSPELSRDCCFERAERIGFPFERERECVGAAD
jgi:transposase